MMNLLKFLNQPELARLNAWKKEQNIKSRQQQNLSEKEPLNTGSIGGLYTYSFTPTSIGLVIKVTNNLTQDVLDLSDYDDW